MSVGSPFQAKKSKYNAKITVIHQTEQERAKREGGFTTYFLGVWGICILCAAPLLRDSASIDPKCTYL